MSTKNIQIAILAFLSAWFAMPAQSQNTPAPETQTADLHAPGGAWGGGFSFGDGLLFTLRHARSEKMTFQLSSGLGATSAPTNDNFTGTENPGGVAPGLVLEGGVNFYGKRFLKPGKQKIKAHGLAVRIGHLFGDFSTTQIAAAWTQEIFRQKSPRRSFNFELGLKGLISHWEPNGDYGDPWPVLPFVRFHWHWYGKKGITPAGEKDAPGRAPESRETFDAPVKKGNIMIGTAAGLNGGIASSAGGRNSAGLSFSSVDGEKTTTFNLSPAGGYFFMDGLLAGVNLGLSSSTSKNEQRKQSSSAVVFGPFLRYYGNIPAMRQLKWTAEAAIAFGANKNKTKVGSNKYENKDGLFSVSLGPGVAWFLNNRVSVEAQLAYERLSVKDKETRIENSTGRVGLRVGLGVFL